MQEAFKLARLRQPAVLVVEELDYMANTKGNRELFYTFVSELDDIKDTEQIIVIATTNRMEDVDKSVRRGGRLDIDIRFDMPTPDDRY